MAKRKSVPGSGAETRGKAKKGGVETPATTEAEAEPGGEVAETDANLEEEAEPGDSVAAAEAPQVEGATPRKKKKHVIGLRGKKPKKPSSKKASPNGLALGQSLRGTPQKAGSPPGGGNGLSLGQSLRGTPPNARSPIGGGNSLGRAIDVSPSSRSPGAWRNSGGSGTGSIEGPPRPPLDQAFEIVSRDHMFAEAMGKVMINNAQASPGSSVTIGEVKASSTVLQAQTG